MLLNRILVGALNANCYVFGDRNEAIVLDPGDHARRICAYIEEQDITVKYIVLTHCHFDHILAAQLVKSKTNAEIIACKAEKENLNSVEVNMTEQFSGIPFVLDADRYISDGDEIISGEFVFRVIETAGHTSGSMCLYCASENILFSGDTLFRGNIGRTDFPTGDYQTLIHSIRTKLYTLPEHTRVLPGHESETTIAFEKKHNPFTV